MKFIPFTRSISLFYKIPALVLISLILSIGIATFISINEQTKIISVELIEKDKFISKYLASSIKGAFWSLNWLFVEQQMQEICNTEDITFLKLIKPNGEVYLFSGDVKLGKKVVLPDQSNSDDQSLKEWINPETGRANKLINTPIKVGNAQWTLLTGISLKSVDQAKARILNTTTLWNFGILLVGVFFSLILTRQLVKPVQQLLEGTKEIGKGHLDYRIDIKSLDEIGALAESFNRRRKI